MNLLRIVVWIALYFVVGFVLAVVNEILTDKFRNRWPFWEWDDSVKYEFFFCWPSMLLIGVFLFASISDGMRFVHRAIGTAITKVANYFKNKQNRHIKRENEGGKDA